jgi:hypothetical protein
MAKNETRWIARLSPIPGKSIDDLLRAPLALDVWERHKDALVVQASEKQLTELERRRLAHVERLSTASAYEVRARRRSKSR